MKVYLGVPRGFCAGVVRAIDIVELALKKFGPPIYVKHQIVHNPHVVNDLERKGAITVEKVEEIPSGSRVIFSAHGSSPQDFIKAETLNLKVIDEVIKEPLGGAHRDRDIILNNVRETLTKNLNYFDKLSSEEIMNERKNKFLKIGRNDGFITNTEDLSTLTVKQNNLDQIFKSRKILFAIIGGLILISTIFLLI